ncbi:hypothetical protein RHMOL_Rhmol08G0213100 [Rhododendron molle]|uniref:Uncharacterized protein n=1 Tax=Rhododendron molle TaxID=49168 RepID=A0ACC0MR31_RHOML|nr:hypothetical protein RHMOL_Rhmol08G0213100 [Rhododendron molle]
MGSGTGNFLKVIARNFDVLAGPVVSLAYPLYASIRAIETKSPEDDRQWLTYWILYSMITLFELTFAKLIEWFGIVDNLCSFFSLGLVSIEPKLLSSEKIVDGQIHENRFASNTIEMVNVQ